MSALFETIRDRNLVKVSPALENTRSEGTEVAGTQRILHFSSTTTMDY